MSLGNGFYERSLPLECDRVCVCVCLLLLLLLGCILFCLFTCLPGRFVIRGVPLIDADPGFVGPFDLVELMIFLAAAIKAEQKLRFL